MTTKPPPTSRPGRWREAVARLHEAQSQIESSIDSYNAALDDLRSVQEEYQEWQDGLPENLQQSTVAEKLAEVTGLDLDDMDTPDFSVAEEAGNVELPLGFGRD